jgi:hypothetical protein
VSALRQARLQQMAARHEQIGERAGDEQAPRVLVEPAVADLGEAEHALDDEERVLNLGPDSRFGPVLRPLFLAGDAVMPANRLAIFPRRITLSLNPGPAPLSATNSTPAIVWRRDNQTDLSPRNSASITPCRRSMASSSAFSLAM